MCFPRTPWQSPLFLPLLTRTRRGEHGASLKRRHGSKSGVGPDIKFSALTEMSRIIITCEWSHFVSFYWRGVHLSVGFTPTHLKTDWITNNKMIQAIMQPGNNEATHNGPSDFNCSDDTLKKQHSVTEGINEMYSSLFADTHNVTVNTHWLK